MIQGKRNRIFVPAAIVFIAAGIIIYGMIDPGSHLFPKCPFYVLTGYKCVGCGSQRFLHSVLNGDFSAAFRNNAFLFVLVFIALGLGVAYLISPTKTHKFINSKPFILTAITAMMLWWILRNVFNL